MKAFKFGVSVITSAVLIFIGGAAQAEDAWNADLPSVPLGSSQIFIAEQGVGQNSSTRFMMPRGEGSTDFAFLCAEGVVSDGGKCDPISNNSDFMFKHGLPKCQSEAEENCIESLVFFSSANEEIPAKFVRQVKGTVFEAVDEARGLYRASTESLWESSIANSETLNYAVTVNATGYFDPSKKRYFTEFLEASVTPFRLVTGRDFQASKLRMELRDGKEVLGGWAQSMGQSCAWVEDGVCGKPIQMQKGLKIKLALRVSNQIKGWFKGRIDEPEISISKFSTTNNRIAVTAKSLSIPRFAITVDEKTLSEKQRMLLQQTDRTGGSDRMIKSTPSDRMGQNGRFLSIDWLDAFREVSKDTAAAESTVWNFSTIRNSGNFPCSNEKSGVLGIVTTNATAFSGVMPTFENKFFKYELAGLHYAPDGKTLNEGTYDLLMKSDFARCLYGFSKAPVSATISVVSESGENKVATTMVRESDGWIALRAAGFTYSSPTISMKLTQAKQAKQTITCAKGKILRKVTGVTPVCPTGYKKK